jgi:hypothetical protein
MNTLPSKRLGKKRDDGLGSRTEVAAHAPEQEVTEKVSYSQIGQDKEGSLVPPKESSKGDGAVVSIDCSGEFSFEKERIRAIEHTQFFASLNTATLSQEPVILSSKMAAVVLRRQLATDDEREKCRHNKDCLAGVLKVVAVVLTLVATTNVICAFFTILFLSISSMPISEYILWLSIEIIMTIFLMYISIKGSNAAHFTIQLAINYLKWLLVYGIALVSVLVSVTLQGTLSETLHCALRWSESNSTHNERVHYMLCIVLLATFFSTLYKLIVTAIYAGISLGLRFKLARLIFFEAQDPSPTLPPVPSRPSGDLTGKTAPYAF